MIYHPGIRSWHILPVSLQPDQVWQPCRCQWPKQASSGARPGTLAGEWLNSWEIMDVHPSQMIN